MKICGAAALALAGLLLFSCVISAGADPVALGPLQSRGFTDFGAISQAQPILSSNYILNNPVTGVQTFGGTLVSSVWSLTSGDYLYLYQAWNNGPSVLQIIGVTPFYDIKEVGWVNSGTPTGFLAGGKTPVQIPSGSGNYAVTYDESGGANVSFGYYAFLGGSVPAGDHTALLYLISSRSPIVGDLHVTDSSVALADGYVTNNVPEPCSLNLMGAGLAAAAAVRSRRRGRRSA